MNRFSIAFNQTGTDKSYIHGYCRWYEEVFKDFTPKTLLEIGVKEGRSLAAWRFLFSDCELTGVDINNKDFKQHVLDVANANLIIADSTNENITSILNDSYDIIIDDGSHFFEDIIKTFSNLKDKFTYAYIIEDAMYKHDTIINSIKQHGFDNIHVFDSHRQDILVNKQWLETNTYGDKNDNCTVDLKLIVVYNNIVPK